MNALRSVATTLPTARTLARRMGTALRSMPRPRIDTRLAAEALGQIKTGIRTAVSQVTRAGTPPAAPTPNDASASPTARLNAYRALARLAGEPLHRHGLPPALQIPSAQELADNLWNSGVTRLARTGRLLDQLLQLSQQLAHALDEPEVQTGLTPAQAVELIQQVRELVAVARAIKAENTDTWYGYSTHLRLWMDRLIDDGNTLMAEASHHRQLQFQPINEERQFEEDRSSRDVATRTTQRTRSKAAPQHDRRARFAQTRTRKQDLSISSTSSSSESEGLLDFSGIKQCEGPHTSRTIYDFIEAFNPIINTIDEQESRAFDNSPGSKDWCDAVAAIIQELHALGRLLTEHGQRHADSDHPDDALLGWFDQKIDDVLAAGRSWVAQAQLHAQEMQAAGYRFKQPVST